MLADNPLSFVSDLPLWTVAPEDGLPVLLNGIASPLDLVPPEEGAAFIVEFLAAQRDDKVVVGVEAPTSDGPPPVNGLPNRLQAPQRQPDAPQAGATAADAPADTGSTPFPWATALGLRDFWRAQPEAETSEGAAAAAEDPAARYTGAGQTVVVIDSGYSTAYDQTNTVFAYDLAWRNDPFAGTSSPQSHGSWVAETVIDQASGVQIIHLKVTDNSGGARLVDIEEALDLTIALTETYDIAAVNLSLGYGNATEETYTQLSDEFAELDDLGVFSIVAAGNQGATYSDGVNTLAADPNVIAVSAVDDTGAFAGFSQTSETLTDIAALGVDVEIEAQDGSVFDVSGTSFAAPEIAGIAALLQEASLDINGEALSDEEFLEILQRSGSTVTGYEDAAIAGYHVADADAALAYFIENAEAYDDPFIA